MIQVKRAYDPPAPADGKRFLVDRLWPRGVKKDTIKLTGWLKEVAPSDSLRKWFNHDPDRWPDFQRRYATELEHEPETWQPLLAAARKGTITLVFGAKQAAQNNAVALKEFLEQKLGG